MDILNSVTSIIITILGLFYAYNVIYLIIGFFGKSKKFEETGEKKKYAIVISARNEEKVIGNLLDSLNKQNYDKKLLKIFVVADNCTDNTAKICRSKGATVYERFDPSKARKGWALEFLFENIKRDYGIESYDGYIIFDADNVVDSNFVHEINKAMVKNSGGVAVGYRNTKNFGTNVISSAYGLHFGRSILTRHRPRQLIGSATHLAGTGYCISSELLRDGWHFHTLTEDTEFTMDCVSKGVKIVYCEEAEFYDEQPTNFFVAFRQRMRWTRGRLVVFFKYFTRLVKGIFTCKNGRWACYDMLAYVSPNALFKLVISAIYPITSGIIALASHQALPYITWLTAIGSGILSSYLTNFGQGILILIKEQKHIKCSKWKQAFYVLCWPWFDLINIPLLVLSCFIPVKWKPILHKDTTKIEELTGDEQEVIESSFQPTPPKSNGLTVIPLPYKTRSLAQTIPTLCRDYDMVKERYKDLRL